MTDKKKYPDAIEAVWKSGSTTIAPSGATFIKGPKWQSLNGRIAMAVLKNKHLRILDVDEKGVLKSQTVMLQNKYGRIRSAIMGPNQALYITTDNGAGQDEVIKITPR